MNGNLYFENDPWARATECLHDRDLGKAAEIAIQCVCPKGTLAENLKKWKARVNEVAGAEKSGNLLESAHVLSYVGKCENGCVVRIFLDDASDDLCENFEIVTERSLIVWKPSSEVQGRMLSTEGAFVECKQQYVADLEVQ